MLATVPRGLKFTAAVLVGAGALHRRLTRGKPTSAMFDSINGIPALRPDKAARKAAANECLSRPKKTGDKLQVKVSARAPSLLAAFASP